jgi:hypothetical protein
LGYRSKFEKFKRFKRLKKFKRLQKREDASAISQRSEIHQFPEGMSSEGAI